MLPYSSGGSPAPQAESLELLIRKWGKAKKEGAHDRRATACMCEPGLHRPVGNNNTRRNLALEPEAIPLVTVAVDYPIS